MTDRRSPAASGDSGCLLACLLPFDMCLLLLLLWRNTLEGMFVEDKRGTRYDKMPFGDWRPSFPRWVGGEERNCFLDCCCTRRSGETTLLDGLSFAVISDHVSHSSFVSEACGSWKF